ncbi:hypothetical protein TEA_008225 [Camellia sinensis var. sinensis]|uniref:Uncharacterized protein n=1 Tax=Camellia sinensis var. sinensis TaxID=542762 RepID=A0A4S4EB10_CAMSN|nr:hypothetical protein TEA_008225 [Camellia sinensis var. sinensis]
MAAGSLRKKSNKRSNLKQPHPAMASTSLSPSYYRKIYVFVMVLLVVCVLTLLSISSSMWIVFGSNALSHQIYSVQVVNEFPHDPTAFTQRLMLVLACFQGLLYGGNDILFESTGLNGQSSVRKVALQTGKVEKFTHQMQDGWGLATDGKILFGSDGTSTLYHIDPRTFKVIQKRTVKYEDHEVYNLNELEYVNGEIWANVWQTDCIARISHEDGGVLGWILLPNLRQGLGAAGNNNIDVLNGIAWDRDRNRIFAIFLWRPSSSSKQLPDLMNWARHDSIRPMTFRLIGAHNEVDNETMEKKKKKELVVVRREELPHAVVVHGGGGGSEHHGWEFCVHHVGQKGSNSTVTFDGKVLTKYRFRMGLRWVVQYGCFVLDSLLYCLTVGWGFVRVVEDLENMKACDWAETICTTLIESIKGFYSKLEKVTGCVTALLVVVGELHMSRSERTVTKAKDVKEIGAHAECSYSNGVGGNMGSTSGTIVDGIIFGSIDGVRVHGLDNVKQNVQHERDVNRGGADSNETQQSTMRVSYEEKCRKLAHENTLTNSQMDCEIERMKQLVDELNDKNAKLADQLEEYTVHEYTEATAGVQEMKQSHQNMYRCEANILDIMPLSTLSPIDVNEKTELRWVDTRVTPIRDIGHVACDVDIMPRINQNTRTTTAFQNSLVRNIKNKNRKEHKLPEYEYPLVLRRLMKPFDSGVVNVGECADKQIMHDEIIELLSTQEKDKLKEAYEKGGDSVQVWTGQNGSNSVSFNDIRAIVKGLTLGGNPTIRDVGKDVRDRTDCEIIVCFIMKQLVHHLDVDKSIGGESCKTMRAGMLMSFVDDWKRSFVAAN